MYAVVVAASLLAVSIPSQNTFASAQNVAGKLSVKLAQDGAGSRSPQSRRRRSFWKRRTIDADDASGDGESSSARKTRRFIERLKMERGIGALILSTLSLVSSWKHRQKMRNRAPESIESHDDVKGQGERSFPSKSVNRMLIRQN